MYTVWRTVHTRYTYRIYQPMVGHMNDGGEDSTSDVFK